MTATQAPDPLRRRNDVRRGDHHQRERADCRCDDVNARAILSFYHIALMGHHHRHRHFYIEKDWFKKDAFGVILPNNQSFDGEEPEEAQVSQETMATSTTTTSGSDTDSHPPRQR